MNPIEHMMLSDPSYAQNYVYHEYEVYTYIMMIVADTRQVTGPLNHQATLLAGNPVNGDVYVAIYRKPEYNEDPPYMSLRLDVLCSILEIRKRSPTLTTGMQRSEREYVNFEKILELEIKKHESKPIRLATEIQGKLLNQNQ
jgi:hypothetical protein